MTDCCNFSTRFVSSVPIARFRTVRVQFSGNGVLIGEDPLLYQNILLNGCPNPYHSIDNIVQQIRTILMIHPWKRKRLNIILFAYSGCTLSYSGKWISLASSTLLNGVEQ